MFRRDFIKKFAVLTAALAAAPKLLAQKAPRFIRFYKYHPVDAVIGWKQSFKAVSLNPTAVVRFIPYDGEPPRTIGWSQYLMRTEHIDG